MMKQPDPSRHCVHIVTVGTSLLTNSGWKPGRDLPAKKDLVARLNKNDPRALSAELNAVLPFVDRGPCTRVHLIATRTREGGLCRDAIQSFLQARRVQITGADTYGLLPETPGQTADQGAFNKGIRDFREKVFRAVQKAKRDGAVVMLNATGGLKAEVAVAALIAAELRIPAYYLHQSMADPVFLPSIAVDPDLRAALRRLASRKSASGRAGLEPHVLDRLVHEGLVKVSRRADGDVSSVRLTPYGRYWASDS